MNNKRFTEKLIVWYKNNKRNLPWRDIRDPYRIWLSEVILQQTRVAQGLPYYKRFVENYENIQDLARADEQQVLRLWQGLGYYSRARNLHHCAKVIVNDFKGKFPEGYKNLLKLPGIGKYTAAAIASFAYQERVPVVDGNVYRVLSRVFGIESDIASGSGQKIFESLAYEVMSDKEPDIYNQAIMEFGATHCTPKSPACQTCIFNVECYARINNQQRMLPVKTKKVKVQEKYFHYIVLKAGHKMAFKKRQGNDIWKGLYDYLLLESDRFRNFDEISFSDDLMSALVPYVKTMEVGNDYKHVLTHRRIFARFFTITLNEKAPLDHLLKISGLKFYDNDAVQDLPKPVLVSRYLNDTIF